MTEDLRPYAGRRVRVVEADRTITGVLDYLVDKHGQPAAGSAVVRDAAVRCGDVVVLAQHAERIEVVEDASESLRERLDALIAAGFGATTDTLRELRAALDDTQGPE